jgi:hypothetical protein
MTDHAGTPDEQEPRHCFGGGPEIASGTGSQDEPFILAPAACTCGRMPEAIRQVQDSGPPMQKVELPTEEGTEVLFYGPGPEYTPGGILLIPAELDGEEAGEQ